MKTVTIEQVENGCLIKDGDKTYVASALEPTSYSSNRAKAVVDVLEIVFAAPEIEAA